MKYGSAIFHPSIREALVAKHTLLKGEVAEWSKAPVSKTGMGQPIESSNLSLSAMIQKMRRQGAFLIHHCE